MSTVTVAKTAGFCFGVRRAVELAERLAGEDGTIWAYGEIIHNAHEIARLEACGVRTAHTLDEIPDGARVFRMRAHKYTEREIARALGVKAQSTLNSRIQKMDAFIRAHRKELEDLLN